MLKLDGGQLTTYIGGVSVWLNGFSDMTYSEFISTLGLVIVAYRLYFDVKNKIHERKKKTLCTKCSNPMIKLPER